MKFSFEQLETFVAVADLQSFRGAAAQLNTTQPNVSNRIAKLESTLGLLLFERDAGSVRLTQKGELLLTHAREVLLKASAMLDAADKPALFDQVLRLGVTELVVLTWLPQFLHELKQLFPNIVVSLSVDLAVNLEQDLFHSALDLAFQSNPFSKVTTGMLPLGKFPMVWVACPDIANQLPSRPNRQQMASFPIITHAKHTKPYAELLEHFSAPSLAARLVPSSNLTACAQMVADGYGISPLSEPLVAEGLRMGTLCQLNYAWRPSELAFFARYDKAKAGPVIERAAELAATVAANFQTS